MRQANLLLAVQELFLQVILFVFLLVVVYLG